MAPQGAAAPRLGTTALNHRFSKLLRVAERTKHEKGKLFSVIILEQNGTVTDFSSALSFQVNQQVLRK